MAGTAAWIDVLPNLSAFGTKLNSGVTAAATSAGRNAGKKFSDAMNQAAGRDVLSEQVKSLQQAEKKAAQAVSQCTSQIAKARDEQKSADLRVQAAEVKLQETIVKSGQSSSQAINAQARLNDARSKARQKTEAVTSAEEQLKAASEGLKETQTQLHDAQTNLNASTSKQSGFFASAAASARNAINSFRSMQSSVTTTAARGVGDSERFFTAWGVAKFGAISGFAQSAFSKVSNIITSNVEGAIKRADTMNNFPKVMKNLGYDSNDAAAAIKRISASIDGLPTTTSSMIGMVQQLAPLTKNLDEATSIALAFNNAVLAGGKDTVLQANAIEQYNQMLSANKVDAAAWRSVVNAMPGQMNQLAKSILGANAKQNDLYEAMKGGKVTFEDFNKALVKLNKDGYGPYASFTTQAKDATQGIGTAMENAKNRVQKAIEKIIEAFGVDRISGVINSFTAKFGDVGSAVAKAVSGSLEFVETGKVNEKLAESFHIDKKSYAGIEDAYQRIRWGYKGLTDFIKTGEFSYEFNRAFENADRQTLIDFKDSLLGIRDSASEVLKNLPGLGEFFNTPKDGDKSNLNKALKAANVALAGLKPLLDLLASIEKAWNGLSADQQGTIFDTAIYLWLGSKGFKILKNIFGVAKDIGKGFGIAGKGIKTAGNALKSFGKFLGGLKAPKWLSSLFAKAPKVAGLDKVPAFAKLTGGTLGGVAAGAAAYGAATKNLTGGLPKWVWKGLQGVQGKDTSDKAYKAYQKWYAENNSVKNPGKFTEWMKGKLAGAKEQAFAGNTGSAQATMSSSQRDAGVKAWNGIKGAFSEAGQAQVDNTAAQVKAQQGTLAGIKKAWGDAGDWINTNWCDLMVKIQSKFDSAAQWVEDRWNGVKDWFGTTGQKIGDFFSGVPSTIGGWFDSAGQWVQSKWQAVVDWLGLTPTTIIDFFTGIPDAISGFFGSAGDWIQQKWQALVDWLGLTPTSIIDFFTGIPDDFNDLFQSAKDKITSIFGTVGDWFDQHVKAPIKSALDAIGNTFNSTKDWIKTSWDQVKDAAKSPVKFIVDTVYTHGIKKVWDSVAGAVGLKLSLPTVKFATGGTVGGINPGYAPGVDSIPAITSPGEAWMVPEWTKAVGAENVYRWNALARRHGVQAVREDMGLDGVQRFAKGGIASKIGKAAGKAVSGAKKFIEDLSQTAQAFVKNPVDWVTSKILTPVKSQVAGISGGQFGQMAGRLPVSAATALVDKVKSMASDLASKWTSKSEAGQYHGSVGGGVERWRSLVLQVLKELGQPSSWADTVLRRMNQESGGNPNAINNWDSNAKAGMPSQGLMQTIPGTFNAYAGPYRSRGITDPLANIYAGCNYAIHRYGSLAGMNRAGGYALGGIVGDDRPTLYDRGGILPPGRHLVANETKQPELVLTREQIVKIFGADVKDKGDRTVNLNVNIPERSDPWADASILVRTARHQLR